MLQRERTDARLKFGHRMGGAEYAVEAVRVGVNCPEERLEREGE